MRSAGEVGRGGLKVHWLLLVAATGLALRFVPASPRFPVDDPNRWAVLGCLAVVGHLLFRGWRRPGIEPHRRSLLVLLTALPVVYLADWVRFGGSGAWLAVEIVGAALFWGLAWLAVQKGPRFLAVGIGAHAGWDLMHFGTSTYVPDWYILACIIIDITVAWVVVRLIRETRSSLRTPPVLEPGPVLHGG